MIFSYLRKVQPGKPHMVMEFWPGWFDHWGEEHNLMPVKGKCRTVANGNHQTCVGNGQVG